MLMPLVYRGSIYKSLAILQIMSVDNAVVEALGYIGGQDEDLGGFCEPLVVRVDGEEHYILRAMAQYRDSDDGDRVKAKYTKLECGSRAELRAVFKQVERRLGIDRGMSWVETDATCGYNIPEDEFTKASSRVASN